MVRKFRLIRPALEQEETLLDQAEQANQDQDSADPKIMQRASDFDEEIKALKEQNQVGSDDDTQGGETETPQEEDDQSDESEEKDGQEASDDEPLSLDDEDDDKDPPEEKEVEEEGKKVEAAEKGGELEEVKQEQAQESILKTLDLAKTYCVARENGYLSPIAEKILSNEISLIEKRYPEAKQVATENENADKLAEFRKVMGLSDDTSQIAQLQKQVSETLGNQQGVSQEQKKGIWERIKDLLKRIWKYIDDKARAIYNWIANKLRAIGAAVRIYSKSMAGIDARIRVLEQKQAKGEIQFNGVAQVTMPFGDPTMPYESVFEKGKHELINLLTNWLTIIKGLSGKQYDGVLEVLQQKVIMPQMLTNKVEQNFITVFKPSQTSSYLTRGVDCKISLTRTDDGMVTAMRIEELFGSMSMGWKWPGDVPNSTWTHVNRQLDQTGFEYNIPQEGVKLQAPARPDIIRRLITTHTELATKSLVPELAKEMQAMLGHFNKLRSKIDSITRQSVDYSNDYAQVAGLTEMLRSMVLFNKAQESLYIRPTKLFIDLVHAYDKAIVDAVFTLTREMEKSLDATGQGGFGMKNGGWKDPKPNKDEKKKEEENKSSS